MANNIVNKYALAMSLSLMCAVIAPRAEAADPPSESRTNFKIGNFTAYCKAKILPVKNMLRMGSYQFGCYRTGPGTKSLEVNFSKDTLYTWRWSALRGSTKSERADCYWLYSVSACITDKYIVNSSDGSYYGKTVERAYRHSACRGQPGWPIHYRFWAQGTITFTVKDPYSGQTKTVTTPEMKGPGTSFPSYDRDCMVEPGY